MRLRPRLAAVVRVRLPDRRLDIRPVVREEPRPRQVRTAVVGRSRVRVGVHPLLVVEHLDGIAVGPVPAINDDRLAPMQAAVMRERHYDVAVRRLARVRELVVQGRMDRRVRAWVDRRDGIAPCPRVVQQRHVASHPRLATVERRIELIAGGVIIVRTRDHVPRILRINHDMLLVIRRRRVIAVKEDVTGRVTARSTLDLGVQVSAPSRRPRNTKRRDQGTSRHLGGHRPLHRRVSRLSGDESGKHRSHGYQTDHHRAPLATSHPPTESHKARPLNRDMSRSHQAMVV